MGSLGSIGHLMLGSGLQEHINIMFAGNAVRHRVRSGIMSIVLFPANILLHMHPISST